MVISGWSPVSESFRASSAHDHREAVRRSWFTAVAGPPTGDAGPCGSRAGPGAGGEQAAITPVFAVVGLHVTRTVRPGEGMHAGRVAVAVAVGLAGRMRAAM